MNTCRSLQKETEQVGITETVNLILDDIVVLYYNIVVVIVNRYFFNLFILMEIHNVKDTCFESS